MVTRSDRVFAGVETKAFSQVDRVSTGNWSAKTLDRWEDLFDEVPVYVGFQGRRGGQYFVRGIRAFRSGVR